MTIGFVWAFGWLFGFLVWCYGKVEGLYPIFPRRFLGLTVMRMSNDTKLRLTMTTYDGDGVFDQSLASALRWLSILRMYIRSVCMLEAQFCI
jgi:hypothetical protein